MSLEWLQRVKSHPRVRRLLDEVAPPPWSEPTLSHSEKRIRKNQEKRNKVSRRQKRREQERQRDTRETRLWIIACVVVSILYVVFRFYPIGRIIFPDSASPQGGQIQHHHHHR